MDIAAVALGVSMIEKTVTLDRMTKSAEHIMSVEIDDAIKMVKAIRDIEIAMGSYRKVLGPAEFAKKVKFRRSLFAKTDLIVGQTIAESDVEFRRPGTGIPANLYYLVLDRRLRQNVEAGEMLHWSHLD